MNLATILAAIVVLMALLVALGSALGAVAHLVQLFVTRREDLDRRRALRLAVLEILLVVVVLLAWPLVAAREAEHRNHWADGDHNGLQDPHTSGSYDWIAVNGATFVRVWGLLDLPVLVLWAVVVRRETRVSPDGPAPRPRVIA